MSFKNFSDLIRLPLGVMASISGLAAGFIIILIENSTYSLLDVFKNYLGQILVGLPIPFLIVCGAMALNDYYDFDADLKNNRLDRPLISGIYSKSFALNLSIIMMVLGAILTVILYLFWPYRVQIYIFPAVLLFIGIAVSYSTWLKKYGFLGNIVVSLSYPAAMFLAMGVVGASDPEAILTLTSFVIMIFFSALGREVLKGVMDIEGDKTQGVKTIAVRYGAKKAAIFCTILFLVAVPFAPIPLILTFWSRSLLASVLYTVSIGATLLLLLSSGINLIRDPSKKVGIKGRKQTKLAFWSLVLGFFLATIVLGLR